MPWILACLALASLQGAAAQLTPITGELLLSGPPGPILSEPRMVPLPEGRFLVRWDSFFVIEGFDFFNVRYVEADGAVSPEQPVEILLPDPFPLASLLTTGHLLNTEARFQNGQCRFEGRILDPQFQPILDLEPLILTASCPLNLRGALLPGPRTALLYNLFEDSRNELWFQRFDALGRADGSPMQIPDAVAPDPGSPAANHEFADLGVHSAGDGVVAWLAFTPGEPTRLLARWIHAVSGEASPQGEIARNAGLRSIAPPKVAMAGNPTASMVIWATVPTPFTLEAQVFHPDGRPRTAPFLIRQSDRSIPSYDVAADDHGRFAVVWTELASDDPFGPWNLFARLYNPEGMPLGDAVQVNEQPFRATTPTVAFSDRRTVLVTWNREVGSPDSGVVARLFEAPILPACGADAETLCLQGDRFTVEVEWADLQGNTGPGKVVPTVSDQSGLFWFFSPDNWELMIKVLDGCGINEHYWVFSAATTNVEYTLTVTDTFSGEVRSYTNPLGVNAAAVTDTTAFATCP
jgi:hypothetical protein